MESDGVPAEQQERVLRRSRRQLLEAPTLLVGCIVGEGLRAWPDERRDRAEWTLAAHSFGAALQNLLLAAHVSGLAAYWISAPLYAQDAVRAALELDAVEPNHPWRPQACIALGRPAEGHRPFDRPAPDLASVLIER
jgi:F420 biosynthesis protein FbiB-like protein